MSFQYQADLALLVIVRRHFPLKLAFYLDSLCPQKTLQVLESAVSCSTLCKYAEEGSGRGKQGDESGPGTTARRLRWPCSGGSATAHRYLDHWAMDDGYMRHMAALDGWSYSRFIGINAKSCHGYDSKTTHIMLPVPRKLSGRRMAW